MTLAERSDVVRVLLVEDDERLASLTARFLEQNDVRVTIAGDGEEAIAIAGASVFDVVLLDLMLPKKSGLAVCAALRAVSDVPIVMVTARGEEADRVLGFEVGADDYVSKPFSPRELLARVRAHVKRARGEMGPPRGKKDDGEPPIRVGKLVLEPASLRVTLAGKDIAVTAYEFSILRVLAERAGRVLTREQLLDLAKGSVDESFDRSIDVRVSRLRQKLGDDSRRPRLLKTVRNAGYMLVVGDDDGGGGGEELE
jgi:two-component system OmpR family response regulator